MPDEPAPAAPDERAGGLPRVLVVKDRVVSGRRYLHELRARGFDVTPVFHGRSALSAVLAGAQDLFIFEVRCNGFGEEDPTLLHVLRRYLRHDDVPVILASFFPDRWTPQRRQELRVADVLHQPILSPAELVDAARRALGLADAPAPRPWPHPAAVPPDRRVA
jgi:CheY-like chemotaxis protein